MSTKNTTVSFADLEHQYQNLSFEAVGVLNGGSDTVQRLASFTKTTLTHLSNKLNSLNAIFVYFKSLNKGQYTPYFVFAKKHLYREVGHCILQVPDGFVGNLKDYAQTLLDTFENCTSKIITDVIDPYNVYISKMVNQPSLLASHSYKHSVSAMDVEKYRKAISKFHTGKKHNTLTLSEVYERIRDVEEHAEIMQKAGELQTRYSIADVKSAMLKLDGNLNALIDVITDKSNNITLSQKVINDISNLTMELAKQVEFFAVVDHLLAALTHCTIENIKPMKRVVPVVSKESVTYDETDDAIPVYEPIYSLEDIVKELNIQE